MGPFLQIMTSWMTLHLPKRWRSATSRDILPSPHGRSDLRDQYGAIKLTLAADPDIDIAAYIARKSPILQTILAESDLTPAGRTEFIAVNNP
jgi:hypothetical protein